MAKNKAHEIGVRGDQKAKQIERESQQRASSKADTIRKVGKAAASEIETEAKNQLEKSKEAAKDAERESEQVSDRGMYRVC